MSGWSVGRIAVEAKIADHPEQPFALTAQKSLVSSTAASYSDPSTGQQVQYPLNESHYPFGPVATAVLSDGSIFVAVQMDANWVATTDPGYNTPGFIRMWHLAPDLTVLGVHDEPWEGIVSVSGNPAPWALAVENNKVVLVVESPYDQDRSDYGDSTDRRFDTGTSYDNTNPPTDPALKMIGTSKQVNVFNSPTSYLQIGDGSSAMFATTLDPVSYYTTNYNLVIKGLRIRTYFFASVGDAAGARWKIEDTRQPYGQGIIAQGTGMGGSSYSGGVWTYLDFPLPNLTSAQYTALNDASIAGKVMLSFDPAGSGVRRLSGVLLYYIFSLSQE